MSKYFAINIEKATLENTDYRRVIYTSDFQQLVLMSIPVGEDIHLEVHDVDQFFRFEKGNGEVRVGPHEETIIPVKDGFSVTINKGTYHRIVNTGNEPLKLYTIYSPKEHDEYRIDHTKPVEKDELTGLKATDFLVMEKLDDESLLKFCLVNKNSSSLCKDETFWKNRFEKRFPESVKLKFPRKTWKDYYLEYLSYVYKLKEEFNYDYIYTGGDDARGEYYYLAREREKQTKM